MGNESNNTCQENPKVYLIKLCCEKIKWSKDATIWAKIELFHNLLVLYSVSYINISTKRECHHSWIQIQNISTNIGSLCMRDKTVKKCSLPTSCTHTNLQEVVFKLSHRLENEGPKSKIISPTCLDTKLADDIWNIAKGRPKILQSKWSTCHPDNDNNHGLPFEVKGRIRPTGRSRVFHLELLHWLQKPLVFGVLHIQTKTRKAEFIKTQNWWCRY